MQFLNENDFLSLINQATLSVVTEDNDTLLNEAESRGIAEMNAYLNVRYDVNKLFEPTERNGLIVMYLCDIVLYHLHSRLSPDNIPELRKDRYLGAKEWLEKTADGFIAPLLPAKKESPSVRYGSSAGKQPHYY